MTGPSVKVGIAVVLAIVLAGWIIFRWRSVACKQRGLALDHRVATLRREAHDKLKVGTKKSDVVRFFTQNGFSYNDSVVEIDNHNELEGYIFALGCSDVGCWDAAEIRIELDVDQLGTVQSAPVVKLVYPDCM